LFSDASGYTQMAETLDPEVVREVMGLVYAKADAIIEKYGGRIDKLMGDAVLAVFGDPVAHEDDAVRAVRAALELHAGVDAMRPQLEARGGGRSFAMHSGINSGIVVTGDLEGDRASGPLGDMVNVASRLQSLAGSGEILIGPETAALVKDRFELSDLGERELKGRRESVRVRRIEAYVTAQSVPSRRASAFVGRQEEIGLLLGAVDRVRDGESALITMCAEAGAGKTRLLEEVRSRLDADVQWLEGRAYPYTNNIPYSPVIDMLARAAGIDERDSAAEVRTKLTAMVQRTLPGDERAMVALAHLFDLAPAGGEVDLESFRSLLLSTVADLIDVVAARAPTVLCLQDLHWVDPSTADLVRDLAGTLSAPVVMICNFRPGFSLEAPGERIVHLSEMSPRQTREQLVSLLDGGDPPDNLVEVVAARTDGNPFFVEEIVNSLIETGVLVHENDGWLLRKELNSDVVPSTIRGLIAARIDNLDPHGRRVLREVSVVGREFLYRLVRSVSTMPDDLDNSLAALAAADLIREKSSDPELEYIFKHALTQEVAYDGLLRRERNTLHERVAKAIEATLGDRTGEFVETLAYHYKRSGHVVEAVDYLRRAGRKALDRYAIPEADAHYRSAYHLLIDTDPDGERIDDAVRERLVLEVILDWCHVRYYAAEFNEIHRLQIKHHDLPSLVGDDALTAHWLGWAGQVAFIGLHDLSRSRELLDEALLLGERCGDATALGNALAWQSWTLTGLGETERALTMWPQIETLLPHISDPYCRRYIHIKGLGGLANAAAPAGDIGRARAAALSLIEIGTQTGNRRSTAMGHINLSTVHLALGNRQAACDAAVAARETEADLFYSLIADMWFIGINTTWGDAAQAQEAVDRWRPVTKTLELTEFSDYLDLFEALLAIKAGQLSRGMKALDDARAQFDRATNAWGLVNYDVAMAQIYAQIATGEASGDLSAVLHNPGFVLKHARGAAKRARTSLEQLAATLDGRGYAGLLPGVEFELAKLAAHDRRKDDAVAHANQVIELLAAEPDATYVIDAKDLLSRL
jgi:class 3 adenylate cyclase